MDLKKQREENERQAQKEAEDKKAAEQKNEKENNSFWAKLSDSADLNDNLTELANYMHKNVGATGVYIGKLEPEMREIKDDDDDTAHIAEDAPLVLKFKHANQDHEAIMVGRVLSQDKGICHDLFKDGDEEKS